MSEENQKSPETIQLFKPRPVSGTNTEAAVARATQEVQAAMVIAKKFPRDETASFNRIVQACKRVTLAEVACYAYPRGGTTVTGPSVRLAECLAQNWGNVDFGIVELDQRDGESSVMAYCWDLETNTRQTKIFTVPHIRRVGKENKPLDDPRDIYEMVANQGARRLRACILGIIPGDVVDAALNQCDDTLKKGHKEPLVDRIRAMIGAFVEFGVTQTMVENRLGHKVDAINEHELAHLRKIYTSLRDGAAKREDFFKPDVSRPDFGEGKPTANSENPLPGTPQNSGPVNPEPPQKIEGAAVPADPSKPLAGASDSTAAAPSIDQKLAPKKRVSLAELAKQAEAKEPYNAHKATKELFSGEGIMTPQVLSFLKDIGAIDDKVKWWNDVPADVIKLVESQWRKIAGEIKAAAVDAENPEKFNL